VEVLGNINLCFSNLNFYHDSVSGLPEAVDNNNNLIVSDYRNPEAWHDKLESVFANNESLGMIPEY
jgi:hypothetical protein